MKDFIRSNPLFSLCGLNCAICPMYLGQYCPGCGGGAGNQSCRITKCSLVHGKPEYCYECAEYPCDKYDGIDDYDSFISHRNRHKDMARAKEMGTEHYQAELSEKAVILDDLLANYNDGRRKTFYCTAVNLLDLNDIRSIINNLRQETDGENLSLKEKAASSVRLFQEMAQERGIELRLRKRSKAGKS
ncbi:DUF3795 domain-containing protein [Anaerolentibacter hominis]|uniref:DUF3795 domain-containing protein n=1 Tax=Anaerolentibacter hominis TaxID=3079009 RepID=UPI0031B80A01